VSWCGCVEDGGSSSSLPPPPSHQRLALILLIPSHGHYRCRPHCRRPRLIVIVVTLSSSSCLRSSSPSSSSSCLLIVLLIGHGSHLVTHHSIRRHSILALVSFDMWALGVLHLRVGRDGSSWMISVPSTAVVSWYVVVLVCSRGPSRRRGVEIK